MAVLVAACAVAVVTAALLRRPRHTDLSAGEAAWLDEMRPALAELKRAEAHRDGLLRRAAETLRATEPLWLAAVAGATLFDDRIRVDGRSYPYGPCLQATVVEADGDGGDTWLVLRDGDWERAVRCEPGREAQARGFAEHVAQAAPQVRAVRAERVRTMTAAQAALHEAARDRGVDRASVRVRELHRRRPPSAALDRLLPASGHEQALARLGRPRHRASGHEA